MYKILFICHGNICRSPMAEFIMKKLIKDIHYEDKVYVESAATSTEEIGSGIYYEAKKSLIFHGINGFEDKKARQVTKDDYDKFDLLLFMDNENSRGLKRIIKSDENKKIFKFLEYVEIGNEVEDPWFTRNFEGVYNQIEEACKLLLEKIKTR